MKPLPIKLINDTIDCNDIEHLCEWLKTNPRLTKGPLTLEFEKQFAKYIGTKYSVFINSGSSANLLMIYATKIMLEDDMLDRQMKVVVPALSWATTLAPVIQFGMHPILCDCNMDNLSIDLNMFETICINYKPDVLMLVSVLGFVPNYDKIVELCEKYNVVLLEDNCEAMGSLYGNPVKINGNNMGMFGAMSSYSWYYGHLLKYY